ncbi:hypothetical protein [Clostridium paridis]|uniref:Uncharacterized protein n=1 Tax=Clostridium paridis TaxID=2803863 RepID=A0A937K232_9CLOT|nr:hypothetical protein [Clostridium paridis]MBL4931031.1 hypothetical protein [Clostridium paridis]
MYIKKCKIEMKKGVILVETIIYLFISSILLCFMLRIIVDLIDFKKSYCKNSLDEDKFSNGIISIESNINRAQVKKYEVIGNKLKISYGVENKSEEIAMYKGEALGVFYYTDGKLTTVNKIMEDVKEVKFIQKGKLVYFFVKVNDKNYEEVFSL